VAGVYDSEKKALDVYLNGELDNGFLLGSITATQRSSRAPVYLGKRTDLEGFDFAGSLDDVRIYSIALTSAEIDTVMRGSPVVRATKRGGSDQTTMLSRSPDEPCGVLSEPYDKHIPIAAAAIGVLAAIGCIGLCPNAKPLIHLAVSFAAGALLLPISASALPAFNLLLIPLVSLGAGASAAFGVRPPVGAEER
jgi:hypothetical protein